MHTQREVCGDARSFSFSVEYPEEYGVWFPTYSKDMDYLISRILTYRSAHTMMMDPETSQYYEGAKTLVEILDLFFTTGIMKTCKSVQVNIENTKDSDQCNCAEINFAFNVDREIVNNAGELTAREYGNYYISLLYTRETADPSGIFIIHGRNTNNLNTFTVGSTLVSEVDVITENLNWLDESAKCFPAGPILKYSENFPTYAMLGHMICEQVIKTCDRIEY